MYFVYDFITNKCPATALKKKLFCRLAQCFLVKTALRLQIINMQKQIKPHGAGSKKQSAVQLSACSLSSSSLTSISSALAVGWSCLLRRGSRSSSGGGGGGITRD